MSGERGEITYQDLTAIRGVVSDITGPEVHPRVAVIDGIVDRLTKGADPITYMRVSLYVGDLASVVEESAVDRDHQEMLEDLRQRHGYQNLTTVMGVPDETSLTLMSELRQKLAEVQTQGPQS